MAQHAGNGTLLGAYEALAAKTSVFRLFIGEGVPTRGLQRGHGPEAYRVMHEHIFGVKQRARAEQERVEHDLRWHRRGG
ncbi:hypothetical protein BH23ACT6_BH23ACT6_15820 [soil metagenome]